MSLTTLTPAVQGYAELGSVDTAFSTIAGGNGNSSNITSTSLQLASSASQWEKIRRVFLVFSTATPLPTLATIRSATLTFTPSTVSADTFTQSLCLTSGVLANETTISASDYQGTNSSKTEYAARITQASLSAGVQSSFTLNAAGLAYLTAQYAATHKIVMCVRWSCDIDVSAPTHPGSAVTDTVNLNNTAALVISYGTGPGHAVIDLTGTLTNSADSVTCNLFSVEVWT